MADAILVSATALSARHPLRSPLLRMLGPALLRQAAAAGSADDGADELARVLHVLERLPEDTPDLEQTLTLVGAELIYGSLSHRSAIVTERVAAVLAKVAERLPPGDPAQVIAEGLCAADIAMRAVTQHRPDLLENAAERVAQAASSTPVGHVGRPFTVLSETCLLMERYSMSGELRYLDLAERKASEFFDAIAASSIPWPDIGRGYGHQVRGLVRIAKARHFPEDPVLLSGAVSDLELAVELIGEDNPLYPAITAQLVTARSLSGLYLRPDDDDFPRSASTAARKGTDQVLKAADMAGPDHPDYTSLLSLGAVGLILQALADNNPGQLDQAISLLATACSRPARTTRERIEVLHAHGSALLLRYRAGMEGRDLSNAIDRLEEARRTVEQDVASPHASRVYQSLAEAYRVRGDPRRGDIDRAVAIGLAALREHAGDILLQDNDENALGKGRSGAEDAFTMARWFLRHGRPGPAVSAIELGRGMVLHAATVGDELPDLLRNAGHEALAQEWERERSRQDLPDPDQGDELRYRTMTAIEGSESEARLLAAPSVEVIRSALAATGGNALVYLLPQDDDGEGLAVVVDRAGVVTSVPLPGLRAGPGGPLHACEEARRNADRLEDQRSAGHEAAEEQWRATLGELCDWAWATTVGPLLGLLTAADGRRCRIVLVPVGQLGLVPWHASRQPTAGRMGRRPADYAGARAVFSYAASARQFTEAAARLPRPWAERPVLVTDSHGSSFATASGLEYIRARYYPAGAMYGGARSLAPEPVPGSLTATAKDVLNALPGAEANGASVLHFGGHGRAVVPTLNSYIDLGAGGKLGVRDVLRQARRSSEAQAGGLVVLAACLSDLAEADHDEALTLATAFLSAGSAGVVGARWRVTEHQTALFMVAFHRELTTGSTDPAEALRAAQQWMLDPAREPPVGLPKVLADEVCEPGLADPAAWAAFAYLGR
jgi:hypothetical protein